VENSSQIDPADWAYSNQLSAEISKLLETLSPRDALVVRLRFGIDGAEPLTLKRIGQLLGVSRERIRQLEVHALAHLRKHVNPNLQQALSD
jgi:RNA polymerase sigma factor (sigma-70 family)